MPSRGKFQFGNSSVRRDGRLRIAGWLAAGSMVLLGIMAPASALAAGPGNNGLDPTGNGTKSNATVNGSLADAGGSATLNADGVMTCDGTSVGSISGTFTLNTTLDVGSKITLYLVPNNGSDASPVGNVPKNESTITLTGANNTSGTVIHYTVNVTSPFTTSSGGVLVVFAVNDDGTTAISSSKSNSLNCTEAPSAPPSSPPYADPARRPPSTPTADRRRRPRRRRRRPRLRRRRRPRLRPTPPSSPPEIGTFSVATCPVTGVPVPVGQSAISIKGSILAHPAAPRSRRWRAGHPERRARKRNGWRRVRHSWHSRDHDQQRGRRRRPVRDHCQLPGLLRRSPGRDAPRRPTSPARPTGTSRVAACCSS